jgi:hypothetical protein
LSDGEVWTVKKLSTRIVVAVVAGALVVGGGAVAIGSPATGGAVAAGAETALKAPTQRQNFDIFVSMDLRSKSPVNKGTTVKIRGQLTAIFTTCTSGMAITTPAGVVTTDQFGGFSWQQRIRSKTKVTATFGGFSTGVHPDIINCGAATANRTIKVN